jgi:uncharacterized repeat protein (TIGR01451 family)
MRLAAVVAVCAVVVAASAAEREKGVVRTSKLLAVPYTSISSAGPLTDVFLGNELSAQIAYSGGPPYQVYPPSTIPGDYGTFLVVDDVLYSPDFDNHDGTATSSIGTYTAHSPVSQSGVTGSGTAADPYQVVTTADVGSTGLSVTQTDSYVLGDEFYRTDMVISNSTGAAIDAILYRAMDCYLGGSDSGYGFVTGSAVGCSVNPNNTPPGLIEQLVPITPGNAYYQDYYGAVWTAIGAHAPFNNTCQCDTQFDNGAGVSWNISVPAGGSVTVSHYTVFSPMGVVAVSTSKTADESVSAAGATNGYTITFDNPNAEAVTLTTISDTLPAGFTYVTGSSSGATTTDPAVSGQQLTWTGSFAIPAAGSLSLHFQVVVASVSGTYYNLATGDAAGIAVAPTGDTAPITVSAEAGAAAIPTLDTAGLVGLAILLAVAGAFIISRLRS